MKRTIKMSKKTLVETISNAVIKKLVTEGRLSNKAVNQAIDDEGEYDRNYESSDQMEDYIGKRFGKNYARFYGSADKIIDLYLEEYPNNRNLIQQAYQTLYQQWEDEFNEIKDERYADLYDYYEERLGDNTKDIEANINDDVRHDVNFQRLPKNFYEQLPKAVINAIENSVFDDIHEHFDPYR